MAWVDSMRLRRRADKVRAVGWINLFMTIVWSVLHASDGITTFAVGFIWAAAVMAATHVAGWMIDKHAERVVRR